MALALATTIRDNELLVDALNGAVDELGMFIKYFSLCPVYIQSMFSVKGFAILTFNVMFV